MLSFKRIKSTKVKEVDVMFKQMKTSILICIVLFFSLPLLTSAHAYIISSSPSENKVLQVVPKKVSIEWNENIQKAFFSLQVFDQTGKQVDQNNAILQPNNPKKGTVGLPSNLKPGIYSTHWSIVSSDGHPLKGTIPFQIGDMKQARAAEQQKVQSDFPGWDNGLSRGILYTFLSLFMGFLFIHLFIRKEGKGQVIFSITSLSVIIYSYIGILITLLATFIIRTHQFAGLPYKIAINENYLKETLLQTTFGYSWMAQIGCLVIIGFILLIAKRKVSRISQRSMAIGMIIAGSLLLLAKSFDGHPYVSKLPWLSVPTDFLHLFSASVWIGSLIYLAAMIPWAWLKKNDQDRDVVWSEVERFSFYGIILVSMLLISGTLNTFLILPEWKDLWGTAYGWIIIIKVILLALMVALASFHRANVKKRGKSIRKSIIAEFAIGIMALMLAGFLTHMPTENTSPKIFKETNQVITLSVSPNEIGKNNFNVQLEENSIKNKEIDQVTITLTPPNGEQKTIQLKETAKGEYGNQELVNLAGSYNIKVHVLFGNLDEENSTFKVEIK
jgi:copper transport protein